MPQSSAGGASSSAAGARSHGHSAAAGSPSKPPAGGSASSRAGAGPRPSAAPPWATHGKEAERSALPAHLVRRKVSAPAVQFRGTDSLASMHLIDQDMAADSRLSQRLGLTESTMHPRGALQKLTAVDEAASLSGTLGQTTAHLRASSLGRGETLRPSRASLDDRGRSPQPSGRSRPSGSGPATSRAFSSSAAGGGGGAGRGPPWKASPAAPSSRPGRDAAHAGRAG
eukprot:TRINITY_DN31226_c0_g1_i1.p1 TRINITY_DN31226_c0_g1~~TRINITY_DN31226_c0_g1_i1.p1  ORF type:complete len:227 (+),score=28.40 TRINITY_DN31226_c0_g1_i1:113-793(+)